MKEMVVPYYIQFKAEKERIKDYLFGSREYKKFVIVSDSRTGSTLLMHFLNSHPEIICLGEEFKKLNGISCNQRWKEIFRKRPKAINRVGFKLFYYHPLDSKDKEVWDFIEEDKDIVILHLTRSNILKSFVSKKIGLKTRLWTDNIKRPNNITKTDKIISLGFEDCKKNFENIENYRVQTEQRFKEHKIIPVIYEELARNNQKTMDFVFQELEVAPFKVLTNMKKQNPEPIKELVLNYTEIKEGFRDTKWEYLFYLDE